MTDDATGAGVAQVEAPADGLVLPCGGQPSLTSLLPGVAGALGAREHGEAARALLGLPRVERACVVLVDGLGHLNLSERAGHAPFLRGLVRESAPLTTTFPSTTATALGSFGTGRPPGATAMLGYTVRDPASGRLGNLVSWTDLPSARAWQPGPTVFESLVGEGVRVTSVGPARFAGSGLTEAALRGASYRVAESLGDRVDATLDSLRRPGLTYLYWGDVDKAGHHHGWGSRQWGDALEALDAELSRLARRLPRGTLLVVTADHGMVDVDRAARWDVATHPELRRDVALVAGEPRASHLHLDDGADAAAVADRWRAVLGDAAVVATRDDAVARGWFGDVGDHAARVIGDVVVAMTGRATVVDSATQTPASMDLVGVHGSLTRHEMLVPFLVVLGGD
ncbi:alkaline phosphatase family protein [Cellulomonas fimi]|uniref:Type I phosphodiesterase/nucleotide pyrophosphatase n=1 Tax=Cellulomonas fimi (strain ATCC 484 / DSM 20113 / JCM 1341 / CCUG 24087 / LMG 16345 / NBRC 15513 / NCIMB 8980 / NCTC 7547 / NRS-133) TaxID=590998 RepID=F4H1I3_CELFA|nr:alkaline phosphatase family protein [Cellulomonas fimi]AEE46282.1 type I phosphodiesterase/nucleotide pyrophosphatase [Cellulomonas fimi ATCC 484]NNH06221.1 phosphodiesterase [Cellulomonas fimi]VEH32358.1 phosphopentomutase [Cellulomonas fimi]